MNEQYSNLRNLSYFLFYITEMLFLRKYLIDYEVQIQLHIILNKFY